jgi:hypothetical protein
MRSRFLGVGPHRGGAFAICGRLVPPPCHTTRARPGATLRHAPLLPLRQRWRRHHRARRAEVPLPRQAPRGRDHAAGACRLQQAHLEGRGGVQEPHSVAIPPESAGFPLWQKTWKAISFAIDATPTPSRRRRAAYSSARARSEDMYGRPCPGARTIPTARCFTSVLLARAREKNRSTGGVRTSQGEELQHYDLSEAVRVAQEFGLVPQHRAAPRSPCCSAGVV